MTDEKRPSLRAAARCGAAAIPAAPAAAAAASPPPAKASPPQKPKPPVVGVEQVAARCGHAVPLELFEPKKDKFRDGRRAKLAGRDCPECRNKANDDRTAAEMEAARQRRQERPPGSRRGGPGPSAAAGRLPDGSRFDVAYDAAAERWAGTLAVPAAAAAEPAVFSASASGVFQLLRALDRAYRDSLPAQGGSPGAGQS